MTFIPLTCGGITNNPGIEVPEEPLNTIYWPPIKVYKPRRVFFSNSPSGANDIYTCPANTRALWGYLSGFNPTASPIVVTPTVKVSGTTWRVRNDFTCNPNARGVVSGGNVTYILEEGDTISVSTSAVGLNLSSMIVEYPNTISVFNARLFSLTTGYNSLYVCPTGKRAGVFYGTQWFNQASGQYYANESGATRQVTFHFVPSGMSPGTGTKQWNTWAIPNNTIQGGAWIDTYLEAGDSIVVEIDDGTGKQSAYIAVMEFDA